MQITSAAYLVANYTPTHHVHFYYTCVYIYFFKLKYDYLFKMDFRTSHVMHHAYSTRQMGYRMNSIFFLTLFKVPGENGYDIVHF